MFAGEEAFLVLIIIVTKFSIYFCGILCRGDTSLALSSPPISFSISGKFFLCYCGYLDGDSLRFPGRNLRGLDSIVILKLFLI